MGAPERCRNWNCQYAEHKANTTHKVSPQWARQGKHPRQYYDFSIHHTTWPQIAKRLFSNRGYNGEDWFAVHTERAQPLIYPTGSGKGIIACRFPLKPRRTTAILHSLMSCAKSPCRTLLLPRRAAIG